MNHREQYIAEKYKIEGWTPLRNGAPDFIMLKVNNNNITDMMAVEVKSPKGRLTYEQKVWKEKILEKAGIKYKLEVVE